MEESIFQIAEQIKQLHKKAYDIYLPLVDDVCRRKVSEKELLFSVTDTGCGIPKDKQANIFQRFEKLNENTQGSGLGLSICQLIIEHIGGKIWIDPDYTGGSRFCFTHPVQQPCTTKGRKEEEV